MTVSSMRRRTVFGPVDLFCANAGIGFAGDEQTAPERWDFMWQVNLMSHVHAARRLVPGWLARGDGYFLSTASAAGLLTNLKAAQYSVTKHAAVAFAEWLAITYGDQGIKVSCLCPMGVKTPLLDSADEFHALLDPLAIEPAEVAEAVVAGLVRGALSHSAPFGGEPVLSKQGRRLRPMDWGNEEAAARGFPDVMFPAELST